MISKELLSKLLNKKVTEVSTSDREARERGYHTISGIFIIFEDNRDVMINIYELAHKCKEWAFINGFVLSSYKQFEDDNEPIHWICEWYSNESKVCFECSSHEYSWKEASSEPAAIFKACQWILDNKDSK